MGQFIEQVNRKISIQKTWTTVSTMTGNLNRTREGVPFKCARNTHKDHILDHETNLDETIQVVHSVSSAHMEFNEKSTTGRYLENPQIHGKRMTQF